MKKRALLTAALLLGLCPLLFSQAFDADFQPDVRRPGDVRRLLVLPDGRFYAAGTFDFANQTSRASLVRFLPDGQLDLSFQTTLTDFHITALARQADGKLLAGGYFTGADAPEGITVLRINVNGSRDFGFQAGFAPGGNLNDIAVEANGTILVGGAFVNFAGQPTQGAVRLSANGNFIQSIPLLATGSVFVNRLLVQPNGRFLIGGVAGPDAYLSQHLPNGAPVPGFSLGLTIPGTTNTLVGIRDMRLDNLGRIVFTASTFLIRYAVIILNPDGSYADWEYVFGIPMDIAIDPSNNIFIAGDFEGISSVHHFHPTSGLQPYSGGIGADGLIRRAVIHPEGGFLVAGHFSAFNGQPALSLERLSAGGTPAPSFNPSVERPGIVRAMLRSGQDKLYIAGEFSSIGSTYSPNVGRIFLSSGAPDPTFNNPGISYRNAVNAIALDGQGRLLIAGTNHDNANALNESPLLRLLSSGAFDPNFALMPENYPIGRVRQVLPLPNGQVLVGGDFHIFNPNIIAARLVLFNPNGSPNTAFASRVQAAGVWEMHRQADGKILIGGTQIRYDGGAPTPLLRLLPNLERDLGFQAPSALSCGSAPCRFTFATQPDGRILAGGSFLLGNQDEDARFGIFRMFADGNLDDSFNLPGYFRPASPSRDGEARRLRLFPNGQILAVGTFDSLGTLPAAGMYVLNPDGSPADDLGMIAFQRQEVMDALIFEQDEFLISGLLFDAAAPSHSGLARVTAALPLRPFIAGQITSSFGHPVRHVELSIAGQPSANLLSALDGSFYWDNPQTGQAYQVSPRLDLDHGNGVSTLDLILVNRHILGIDPLTNPYRLIAADVNNSGSVSSLDLIGIQRIIIGMSETFINNTSWRFVPARHVFTQATNPWLTPFPEAITIDDMPIEGVDDADFIAIKIGDLNGDAATALQEISSRTAYRLLAPDARLSVGASIAVPIRLAPGQAVEGCQFTLQFDPSALQLEDVDYGLAGENSLGWRFLDRGWITASWIRQPNDGAEAPLMTLYFRARQAGELSRWLSVGSGFTPAEAYDENLQAYRLALEFEGMEKAAGLALMQNHPNPFRGATNIGFELPQAGEASLLIHTPDGRLLHEQHAVFPAGYHELQVHDAGWPEGLLFYTLRTSEQSVTQRMMVLK
jgi:uncharacterized delta-60 repeat protein